MGSAHLEAQIDFDTTGLGQAVQRGGKITFAASNDGGGIGGSLFWARCSEVGFDAVAERKAVQVGANGSFASSGDSKACGFGLGHAIRVSFSGNEDHERGVGVCAVLLLGFEPCSVKR